MRAITILLNAVVLAALLASCAQPAFQDQPAAEFPGEVLYPVRDTGFREAYARRDADLAQYRAVVIEPLQLDQTQLISAGGSGVAGVNWQITPKRAEVLGREWLNAMNRAFAGYSRGGSSEKALRITAALTRVVQRGAVSSGLGNAGSLPIVSGETADVFMEWRLYDQAGGELLGVVRDDQSIPAPQWSLADGANMANLFRPWAAMLHTRVSGR